MEFFSIKSNVHIEGIYKKKINSDPVTIISRPYYKINMYISHLSVVIKTLLLISL